MYFGQQFGNPFGKVTACGYYVECNPGSPPERILSWDASHGSGVYYHLYLDGRWWGDASGCEVTLPAGQEIRCAVEVFETSLQNRDESCAKYATTPQNAAWLSWSASGGAEIYRVYRSTVPDAVANGTMLAEFEDTGQDSYEFTDYGDSGGGLPDGNYYYAVEALDGANNPTDSNEVRLTVDAPPGAPTGLALTFTG